jgi:excisionase family DNA binding protein
MTVTQVASVLHLSQNTVRSLLMRQVLPGKKVGMKWIVRKESLLAYLENP